MCSSDLLAAATAATSLSIFARRSADKGGAFAGAAGQGDGVYAELLKRPIPDLSTMARRNGGVFPVAWPE